MKPENPKPRQGCSGSGNTVCVPSDSFLRSPWVEPLSFFSTMCVHSQSIHVTWDSSEMQNVGVRTNNLHVDPDDLRSTIPGYWSRPYFQYWRFLDRGSQDLGGWWLWIGKEYILMVPNQNLGFFIWKCRQDHGILTVFLILLLVDVEIFSYHLWFLQKNHLCPAEDSKLSDLHCFLIFNTFIKKHILAHYVRKYCDNFFLVIGFLYNFMYFILGI